MENINQNETTSQTQSTQILKALKNGERLTHLDAEKRFNCLRLGARIYDLKKRGHNIISKMITVPSGKRVPSIGWRRDMKRFNRPVRIDVLLALYCQKVLAKLAKLDEEIFNED